LDLETRLSQALEEVSQFSSGSSKRSDKEWLPSEPARNTLSGHRDKINAVGFHPSYSVLASASVDATVKVWDWESGDLERTLKGHTKSVRDCKYDSAGKVLGERCFLTWRNGFIDFCIATCSDDLFIKLWSVPDDYKNFATLRGHEHSISTVCFLPGDNQVLSSSRDRTVRVWDVQTR
jgi:platelet-activating factor acetylhydrolase IB subunit alpha